MTQLAALVCQVPWVVLGLRTGERLKSWSQPGLEGIQIDYAADGWDLLGTSTALLEVEDTRLDPRFSHDPFLMGPLLGRSLASYPLHGTDGRALGVLTLLHTQPHKLAPPQLEALGRIGDAIARIWEQYQQQQEIHHLKNLFVLANDLICVADTDGFFKEISPAFHRLMGWPEDYLLRTPLLAFVHPDDLVATRHELARLATGQQTVNFENRLRCQDGTYRTLQWVTTTELDTGQSFAIARDVTAQKQQERQFYHAETK
ncbi:PAS domain S-box protein, partial [Nostoc sp. CHAB 5834]|nr:PAS domain S-box protein [Nostoc sp. CHAB 5834]